MPVHAGYPTDNLQESYHCQLNWIEFQWISNFLFPHETDFYAFRFSHVCRHNLPLWDVSSETSDKTCKIRLRVTDILNRKNQTVMCHLYDLSYLWVFTPFYFDKYIWLRLIINRLLHALGNWRSENISLSLGYIWPHRSNAKKYKVSMRKGVSLKFSRG